MRIISGIAKGRRLVSPGKKTVGIRPTSDKVRQAIFNILGDSVHGQTVIDLYAGTGGLGLEALSRGATMAFFVDNHREALLLIQKNIELCGFSDRSQVLCRDLTKGLFFGKRLFSERLFDLVFLDPPYRKGLAVLMLEEIAKANLLSREGRVVVEEAKGVELPEKCHHLALEDRRNYGDTLVCIYQRIIGADSDGESPVAGVRPKEGKVDDRV